MAVGPLLTAAYRIDGSQRDGLFGVLHGLRCCDVAAQEVDGHFRLIRGELSEAEYAATREAALLPHADRLRQLLNPDRPETARQSRE